ncbi:MAG: hypothetical protein H6740_08015 [Alphaproteobacteria bacterium]|nr:hypothetical protein [Alphaproteobacteria bacterium]
MRSNRTLLMMFGLAITLPLAASAQNGAVVSMQDIDVDDCFPLLINPPPGSGLPPMEITHCEWVDARVMEVETPSGLTRFSYHGDRSFEDYNADGVLLASGSESARVFNLTEESWDGEVVLRVRRVSQERCMENPGGATVFTLEEAFAGGEPRFRVVDVESVDTCD